MTKGILGTNENVQLGRAHPKDNINEERLFNANAVIWVTESTGDRRIRIGGAQRRNNACRSWMDGSN